MDEFSFSPFAVSDWWSSKIAWLFQVPWLSHGYSSYALSSNNKGSTSGNLTTHQRLHSLMKKQAADGSCVDKSTSHPLSSQPLEVEFTIPCSLHDRLLPLETSHLDHGLLATHAQTHTHKDISRLQRSNFLRVGAEAFIFEGALHPGCKHEILCAILSAETGSCLVKKNKGF